MPRIPSADEHVPFTAIRVEAGSNINVAILHAVSVSELLGHK
jgi:hypothetical protein